MEDNVVIDNPPFSIVSKICKYYNEREIPFFLFAPYLTNFSIAAGDENTQHVITDISIIYENGAKVNTSFVTNMDGNLARSCPDLQEALRVENDKNLKLVRKSVPKYDYPDNLLRATDLGYLAKHGVELRIGKESAFFVRELDAQKARKKSIFGSGFLLSERATADRVAADKAALEKKKEDGYGEIIVWRLSNREQEICKRLV